MQTALAFVIFFYKETIIKLGLVLRRTPTLLLILAYYLKKVGIYLIELKLSINTVRTVIKGSTIRVNIALITDYPLGGC